MSHNGLFCWDMLLVNLCKPMHEMSVSNLRQDKLPLSVLYQALYNLLPPDN